MAKDWVVTSDLSGKAGAETHTFMINGSVREIDLTDKEAQEFLGLFNKYVDASRPATNKSAGKARSRGSKAPSKSTLVRAWAREQGIPVNERGAVSKDVAAKYDAAHI